MSRTEELQLLAKQLGNTARGVKGEPAKVVCKSCRVPRLRVAADGVCAICLRGQAAADGDPPVEGVGAVELVAGPEPPAKASSGGPKGRGKFLCRTCWRKVRTDGTRLQADGTATHGECGSPVELLEDGAQTPKRPAKAPRKARVAPKAPKALRQAHRAADGVLAELRAMQQILDLFGALSSAGRGWVKARLGAEA